ncbi:MAG: DUF452 family protein [Muribaculaceae bacterium]|nr:DUF452 family protein [Muribaculaceae bacterium]
MKTRVIFSQPANRRLILIFAGWSTTPSFYRDLQSEGWDIAVVWDYTDLDFDPSIINNYSSIFIIAWSLGVAAAAHAAASTLPVGRISAAFAVNGTLFPSSDHYGIPEDIYEATRATLNARNLLKFTKRMGYIPPAPESMPPIAPEDIYIPDFDSLALELENIRSYALRGKLPWKRVYISTEDRIFPAESMHNYWISDSSKPQIVDLKAPHYVHLQRIINEVTPDIDKISKRFQRAVPTYDANASAQKTIISNLVQLLPDANAKSIGSMLEIGTGSGMLSRCLAEKLPNLNDATFLDLYSLPRLNIAPVEKYIRADAEKWILDVASDSYDLIASANTIQWFADPESFFRNVARALRPGGSFLCSTFLKGNLEELDSMRPSPLLYRDEEELKEMLLRHFSHVTVKSEPIRLNFKTRRELLLHLKLTGVAGGSPSGLPYRNDAPSNASPFTGPYSLTYRPLYIFADNS